jgi:hypothetical protein
MVTLVTHFKKLEFVSNIRLHKGNFHPSDQGIFFKRLASACNAKNLTTECIQINLSFEKFQIDTASKCHAKMPRFINLAVYGSG